MEIKAFHDVCSKLGLKREGERWDAPAGHAMSCYLGGQQDVMIIDRALHLEVLGTGLFIVCAKGEKYGAELEALRAIRVTGDA